MTVSPRAGSASQRRPTRANALRIGVAVALISGVLTTAQTGANAVSQPRTVRVHDQEVSSDVVSANGLAFFTGIERGSNGGGAPCPTGEPCSTPGPPAPDDQELWVSDGSSDGTHLLKDINPAGSSAPGYLMPAGSKLFFFADDGTGQALWISDGSPERTEKLKVLTPDGTGDPGVAVNGRAFFAANDGTNGNELWISDQTSDGTVLVRDVNPGEGSATPQNLTRLGDTLYFTAYDGQNPGLWKSDGTPDGTQLVLPYMQPAYLTPVESTLYFVEPGPTNTLWKTDGTEAGTMPIRPFPGASLHDLTDVNGRLFFTASDPGTGPELWTTDGTDAGTVLVSDIRPGAAGSDPSRLFAVGTKLFFSADDGTGQALWVTHTTEGMTFKLADVGLTGQFIPDRVAYQDRMVFAGSTPSLGVELWISDGTQAGTRLLRDIAVDGTAGCLLESGHCSSEPGGFAVIGETTPAPTVFFHAREAERHQLWKTAFTANEFVFGSAPAGGSFSSDTESDGATPDDPIETTVTHPLGGSINIFERAPSGPISNYRLLDFEVGIDVDPAGTPAQPLTIVFRFDATAIEGEQVQAIDILRDGQAIPDCSGSFDSDDDVCVSARDLLPDGDLQLSISTVHASTWNFGVSVDSASGPAPPGGTVTTDPEGDGATPQDPVETSVTSPSGGEVTIQEGPATGANPDGFSLLGQQVSIEAPAGTPAEPLTIVFTFDASQFAGVDPQTIEIFRDGVLVEDCTGADFTSEDDVCVVSRDVLADGDLRLTVRTVHASTWAPAVRVIAFSGFFEPVDNPPILNKVPVGKSVPVRFSLGGDHGLNVLAPGAPTSQSVPCPKKAKTDQIEETTRSPVGLSYDATSDRYTYVWNAVSTRGWQRHPCRMLTFEFIDGTIRHALFRLN